MTHLPLATDQTTSQGALMAEARTAGKHQPLGI